MQVGRRCARSVQGATKKRDKVLVYLMVVKSVSWYWYSSVQSELWLVLVVGIVLVYVDSHGGA